MGFLKTSIQNNKNKQYEEIIITNKEERLKKNGKKK